MGDAVAWLAGPWLGNAASDRDWRTPDRSYFFASESFYLPTSETTPDMIRIDFQRVAHLPERERSAVLVMKKPALGFRKLLLLRRAASVEIDLIASHCIESELRA